MLIKLMIKISLRGRETRKGVIVGRKKKERGTLEGRRGGRKALKRYLKRRII